MSIELYLPNDSEQALLARARMKMRARAAEDLAVLAPEEYAQPVIEHSPDCRLYEFAREGWHVLEPTTPFIPNWHIHAISELLEAATRREIRKFIINIPPRCEKSLQVCVFWFAWTWTFQPSSRWLFSSYADQLSTRDSVKCRDLILSPWYQSHYGSRFKLKGDMNLKTRYENDKTGLRIATGVGGVGTGEGGDYILCLCAHTLITTDAGLLPIGEIVEKKLPVSVLGFDHTTGRADWHEIEAYESGAGRTAVRVALSNGLFVESTVDHPFYVIGKGYVEAGALHDGDEVLTDESTVSDLWGRSVPRAIASGESEEWNLLQPCLSWERTERHTEPCFQRREDRKDMRSVRAGFLCESFGWAAAQCSVLLAGVPPYLREEASGEVAIDLRQVRALPSRNQNHGEKSRQAKLLFACLCECRSSRLHQRSEQPALCAWSRRRKLSGGISDYCTADSSARPTSLSVVSPDARREWQGVGRASHRLQQRKQCNVEPTNTLPLVSWSDARLENFSRRMATAIVRSVESIETPACVYNLRIHSTHNYFANGTLLHNCDDPHKVQEAESSASIETTVNWWNETMSTRGNNPKTVVHGIVMQRVADNDLTGDVIAKELGYTHLCYDRETEVLTRRGWVRFDELPEGEEVAQVDTSSLAMSFVAPDAYTQYRYQGEMVRYLSDCVDLLVTPDHRMVYKDENDFRQGDDRYNWRVRAAAALPGSFYLPQSVEWNAPDVAGVMLGGEWVSGDDFVRFMGAWLSEGCTRAGHPDVVISQDAGRYAEQIEALLARLPYRFNRITQGRKRPDHLHFLSYHRALFDDLRRYGKSGDKYVPEIIKGMSARQIALFLQWYEWGDGHRYRKNSLKVQYVSKSRRLIDDVQELMLRVGKTGGLQKHPNCWRVQERVHKHRGGAGYKWYGKVRVENTTREAFDDDVFCVSVMTGALLVRRNGKPAVSGNCLPMRYESDHPTATTPARPILLKNDQGELEEWSDPRDVANGGAGDGALLWPTRFDEESVEVLEASLLLFGTAGQLQQRPTVRGGGFFGRVWFEVIEPGLLPEDIDIVRYWDKAGSDEKGDWTAGVLMARARMRPRWFYIIDVVRFRASVYGRQAKIESVAKEDARTWGDGESGVVTIYIEREGGSSGKDMSIIERDELAGFVVYSDAPTGAKPVRWGVLANAAEAGNVKLLRADWNKDFLDEMEKIRENMTHAHDDQADAASGAIIKLALDRHKGSKLPRSSSRSMFKARRR